MMNPNHWRHRPPMRWRNDPESRATRQRFFLRFGIFIALMFGFSCAIFTLVISLVSNWLGANGMINPMSVIVVVFIFAGLSTVGRAFRSFVMPFGDLVEASSRVADGDYSVRVRERGPREVRSLARAFNSMAERLQASDQLRRAMLADVTHELRTPLTVIQGNLEGLVDGVYPRDEAHLQPILDETRILSRLIDDLRTLTLAESGALQLQKEQIDLGGLVDETISSFRAQADLAGIVIESNIAPNLPTVNVDPARIRQVLENLISNALRYTANGGRISVECSVDSVQSKSVVVEVRDSGRGIAAEELPHVFDRFYKSRDSRGTGLGLAIAKNLIAAHGGEISAESEIDKGTTIRFTLPIDFEV